MIDLFKKYVENRIELVKLNFIGAIANVAAGLVSSFLLLIIGIFILLMFSISLAFWLSTFFESEVIGFAIMGLLYFVLLIVYTMFAMNSVELKIKDKIVESALSDEDEFNKTFDDE